MTTTDPVLVYLEETMWEIADSYQGDVEDLQKIIAIQKQQMSVIDAALLVTLTSSLSSGPMRGLTGALDAYYDLIADQPVSPADK